VNHSRSCDQHSEDLCGLSDEELMQRASAEARGTSPGVQAAQSEFKAQSTTTSTKSAFSTKRITTALPVTPPEIGPSQAAHNAASGW
jgi:hypothetical protein